MGLDKMLYAVTNKKMRCKYPRETQETAYGSRQTYPISKK
jgi:hypothetical protein